MHGKTYYNQWPASIKTVLTVKFLLEAKMKNGVFPHISNLSVCQNSVFFNIHLINGRDFQDNKNCIKCILQKVRTILQT